MSRKLGETEGKKFALNMRTTQEIRTKLEAAAAASGKSLAQEAEARLEKSFDQTAEALLGLVDGDTKTARVIRAIANVFYAVSFEGAGAPPYIAREGLAAAFDVILAETFPDPGGLMSDIFNVPDEGAKERARKNFADLAVTILAAHRAKRPGGDQGALLSLVQRAQVLGLLPTEPDEVIAALQNLKKAPTAKEKANAG